MLELWIPISDISPEGKALTIDDQVPWREAWGKYALGFAPARDMVAEVTIYPQPGDGALVRGALTGSVMLPCDRCAEPFELPIEVSFDAYEQLPDGEGGEEPRVRVVNGQTQLDLGAVLWEEFSLALPFKPLCSEECLGICPGCGRDLNREPCACDRDKGDERLAVFRNLKIK
ncbi:MAG: DUF177 domain-containing protein [Pseudodesulfovibrio sp.]